ncbi:hypothetical protein KKH3_03580 [Pectobacterium actinidiae]|nr:hypothetical protein KKH3_03580 [Pectobacterium actinidiae]
MDAKFAKTKQSASSLFIGFAAKSEHQVRHQHHCRAEKTEIIKKS